MLTVHPVSLSIWGTAPLRYPEDQSAEEKTRQVIQEMADKAGARLGASRPASVTVRVVSGTAAEEIISASRDADLRIRSVIDRRCGAGNRSGAPGSARRHRTGNPWPG